MYNVEEVAENIYMIDDQLASIPKMGCVYLLNEERRALVDSGPTTSADAVLGGIKKIGIRPEDIDYIIVTHVHLDHAGGAGVLLGSMPKAQVIVHYKGARHLVNPARLIESTTEAHGKEMQTEYGEVVPIRMERVKSVHEGDVLRLSERQVLRFIDAPGHASHELCIYESRNNGLFVGDSMGIRIFGDGEVLLPVTPPPDLDPELCINTLERLMELNATKIYFAHFGATSKVRENLQIVIDKFEAWNDIVAKAVKKEGFNGIGERIKAQCYAELEPIRGIEPIYKYLTEVIIPLNAAGYTKYYQEKYKAG